MKTTAIDDAEIKYSFSVVIMQRALQPKKERGHPIVISEVSTPPSLSKSKPGPNNPVGGIGIDLAAKGYGICGTLRQ